MRRKRAGVAPIQFMCIALFIVLYPPPPPLEIYPRHFTVLLGNIYCGGLCSPSVTHTFLHCFPITSN